MNSRGFHGSFLRRLWIGRIGQNRDCAEQYEDQFTGVDICPESQGLLVTHLNRDNGKSENIPGGFKSGSELLWVCFKSVTTICF